MLNDKRMFYKHLIYFQGKFASACVLLYEKYEKYRACWEFNIAIWSKEKNEKKSDDPRHFHSTSKNLSKNKAKRFKKYPVCKKDTTKFAFRLKHQWIIAN